MRWIARSRLRLCDILVYACRWSKSVRETKSSSPGRTRSAVHVKPAALRANLYHRAHSRLGPRPETRWPGGADVTRNAINGRWYSTVHRVAQVAGVLTQRAAKALPKRKALASCESGHKYNQIPTRNQLYAHLFKAITLRQSIPG